MLTTPSEAPEAPVIGGDARSVYVRCPYCNGRHQHERRTMPRGERSRRAPGCGNIRTNAQRATGYWITSN
jgi:hypothetical protein